MEVNHWGFIIDSIDKSIGQFNALGWILIQRQIDEFRNVELAFLKNNEGLQIELVMPLNENSVAYNILKKQKNSFYHICYKSVNIEKDIEQLTKSGFILVDAPKSAVAFNNKRVAFLYSKFAGMVELLEY